MNALTVCQENSFQVSVVNFDRLEVGRKGVTSTKTNAITVSFWNKNQVCSLFVIGTFLYLVTSYTITKKEISKYNNWFLFIYVMCKDWGVTIIKYMMWCMIFFICRITSHFILYSYRKQNITNYCEGHRHITHIFWNGDFVHNPR